MDKTVLSFYCDDTNPYSAPPEAFKAFLDFISSEGIAGEASLILGYSFPEHDLLSHPTTDLQYAYIKEVQRAYVCGIDTHFELLTHKGLFDFNEGCIPEGAIHEGLWMYEPAVSVEAYEAYFDHIITEGERIGMRFTGVTWPGCGCQACLRRYRQLWISGLGKRLSDSWQAGFTLYRLKSALTDLREGTAPNPNVWQALLDLAKRGRFRGRTVPCFFGGARKQCEDRLMANEEGYGVYDLPPNADDHLGLWINDPGRVDADYYITSDGQSGRIVELVRAEAPYCLLYSHWQGLNPTNGVGWEAFTHLVRRVKRFLGDQVVWMRPSEYTDHLFDK